MTALYELAAQVQRGRTTHAVLETAGSGALQLGMRLAAFQMDGLDLVLRYVATSAPRLAAIEQRVGRLGGMRASAADWQLIREVVDGRRALYREDLDVFDRFLRVAAGFDTAPLDASPETAGIANGVLAPLWVREKPWGVLLLVSPTLAPKDAAAVSLFATHVASSIELAEYIEALEAANKELFQVYRDLARTQEALAERQRLAALGEVAAVMAHEVRNPIGVVFNAIGSLRRVLQSGVGTAAEDANVLLSILSEEAERLNRIVSDLLDFARPTVPVLEDESMRDVIDDAVRAAIAEPTMTAFDVHVDVASDLPIVAMDARYVRQALLNLLLNGFQAMGKGGGRMTVRAYAEQRAHRAYARVDVSDTGPGIGPEHRARIFEPFFTTKASGTGLGLTVVDRIMAAHGGNVLVDSGAEGTTFSLLLPLAGRPARSPAPAPGC